MIALINERDQYHAVAIDSVAQYDNTSLVITDAILLEIGNALARRQEVFVKEQKILAAPQLHHQ